MKSTMSIISKMVCVLAVICPDLSRLLGGRNFDQGVADPAEWHAHIIQNVLLRMLMAKLYARARC